MLKKLGCKNTHNEEGECVAGDRIFLVCRTPNTKWATSKIRSGSHNYFQAVIKKNAIAKVEQAYTSTNKSRPRGK